MRSGSCAAIIVSTTSYVCSVEDSRLLVSVIIIIIIV